MSLINDALKRASTTRPERPADALSAPPLQPVAETSSKGGPLPLILCITGVGALLVSGAFWLKSKGTAAEALSPQKVEALEELAHSKHAEAQVPALTTPPVSPNPVPVAPAQVAAVEQPQTALVSATVAAPPESTDEATPEPSKPEVAVAPPTKPAMTYTPPKANANRTARTAESATSSKQSSAPKLQAIYYRLKGPTVMINGKTLKQGEAVDGVKVIAIERNGVDVDANGTRQRLTLR